MNILKTVKSIAVILLCLSAVALAGLNIHQYRQIQAAAEKPAVASTGAVAFTKTTLAENQESPSPPPQSETAVTREKTMTGDREADELIYHLESAEEELAVVREHIAADQAKEAERKRIEKELQEKALKDPALKKMIREGLDTQYADLFKKLNISPERLEIFKDMLIEESMAQQNTFMDFGGDPNNLTKEEEKELQQRLQAFNEEYEAIKRDFLGASDYATYQAYSETQHERYQVNRFLSLLDSDAKLTDPQKESLIEAMSEGVKNVVWDPVDNIVPPEEMTEEMQMEMSLIFQTRRHDAYLEAAGSILSSSQLEQFDVYLENQLEQQRLFMEMEALRSETSDDANGVVIVYQ